MARRSSQTKISLFPFLAVLVCTMGALILLLLVTSRRMNQQVNGSDSAIAASDQTSLSDAGFTGTEIDPFVLQPIQTRPAASNAAQSEQTPPPGALSIAELPPAPTSASILAEKRLKLTALQQQVEQQQELHRNLEQQMAQIRFRLQQAVSGSATHESELQDLNQLKHQQSELEQQLVEKQQMLAELTDDLETSSKTVEEAERVLKARESALVSLRKIVDEAAAAGVNGTDQTVVEFTNSTGTRRSPIIVDVTDAGFELLPAGIRITADDMEGFPGNDNPLLAAVLALHEHRHHDSVSVKPYVLLLVRPDGSMPFYTAQRTLTDAGIHFGYELLEQNRRIAAGRQQPEEADVIRRSVLAALNRRQTLYSGLLAEVQQLKESVAARERLREQQASEEGSRSIHMTPDGRLLMSEDTNGDEEPLFATLNDGRHYVGGQAPPPGSLTGRQRPEVAPAFDELTGENEHDAQNNSLQTATVESDQPAPDFSVFGLPSGASPSGASPSSEAASSQPNPFAIAETSEPGLNTDAAAEPHGVFQMPPSAFPDVDDIADATVSSADLRQALRRPGGVLGNLGIGGQRSNQRSSGPSSVNSSGTPRDQVAFNDSVTLDNPDGHPREPTGWPDSGTAPPNSATRPASPAQDPVTDNPFGMANADMANADAAARGTSDFVQNPFEGSSLHPSNGSPSGGTGGATTGEPGLAASSDSQSFLLKFMQQVEAEKGERRPDPMLVSLLKRSRSEESVAKSPDGAQPAESPEAAESPFEPETPATGASADTVPFDWSTVETPKTDVPATDEPAVPEAQQPDSAAPQFALFDEAAVAETSQPEPQPTIPEPTIPQPTAAQRAPQPAAQQQIFYVIRVFVEPNQLTIGDFEAVSTKRWDDEKRLALMAEAVSATMDEVWSSINKEALPAVRFLVAPGAEPIQQTLSKQLAEMDVPTRGVIPLSSGMTVEQFFSPTPSPQSSNSVGPGPAADPATPTSVRPRAGRRGSL
ncbi:MAG: hypothetical protein R3C59_20265 [Planctomycetaceae bacterium]